MYTTEKFIITLVVTVIVYIIVTTILVARDEWFYSLKDETQLSNLIKAAPKNQTIRFPIGKV